MANSLKIAGTIGYYALFTEDFIERFCENKARPELQCNGKCELSKMLLQETDTEKPPINLDFLKNETVLFLASIFKVDFFERSTGNFIGLYYTNLYRFSFMERVIHPPRFLGYLLYS